MKKMFERHRGNDSIDVIFITMKFFHPSVKASHPTCMYGHCSKLSCGMSVLLLGICPQGKKVLLRSRSEPGIYADLRGDRTLDLFGVNEM